MWNDMITGLSELYACGGVCTTTDWVVTVLLTLALCSPFIWMALYDYFMDPPYSDTPCS